MAFQNDFIYRGNAIPNAGFCLLTPERYFQEEVNK